MPKVGAIYSCSYSYITIAKFKVAKYKVWQGRIQKSPTAKLKNAKYEITTVMLYNCRFCRQELDISRFLVGALKKIIEQWKPLWKFIQVVLLSKNRSLQ